MFSSILLCRVSNRCLDISVCSVGKLRSHSTASAALLPSDLGWSANLDVSPLRPGEVLHAMRCEQLPCEVSKCVEVCRSVSKCQGQEYRLCADGDGSGPLHEGTANTGRFGFGSG